MLVELRIENFAIIDRLDFTLQPGLITFTGETGAGKSIIIDAVELLMGGRAEASMIRSGCDRANIEGVFAIPPASREELLAIITREELLDDPDHIELGREIRASGRSVARVNGRNISTSLLRELGEYLIDVHGQSEHLSLLRVSQHLGLLDRYLAADEGASFHQQFQAYRKTYHRLQSVQSEIKEIRQAERDAARRADMLTFQINEIQAARLHPGEDELLRDERNRLANAESLASLGQQGLVTLDEGSPDAQSATELFGQTLDAINGLARLDPTLAEMHDQAQQLFESMTDLSRSLRIYVDGIEFNPKRLDQVEERLGLIHNLKRKYGNSIQSVLEYGETAQRQLDQITHAGEQLETLEAERASLLTQIGEEGSTLSKLRHTAAEKLQAAIEAELIELHMAGARFQVEFQQEADPEGAPVSDGSRLAYFATGLEKVEFLIAPNPGEGLKPLAKIASGGETSRLMLALKDVLAKADHIPTLIFDEIDQGIGGRVGTIVGEKLWELARQQHQVLCITHLPQLAVFGSQHFHVTKSVHDGRTTTQVQALHGETRIRELAQMLGTVSPGTLQSARELVKFAENKQAQNKINPI